jgi:hypothetical protein
VRAGRWVGLGDALAPRKLRMAPITCYEVKAVRGLPRRAFTGARRRENNSAYGRVVLGSLGRCSCRRDLRRATKSVARSRTLKHSYARSWVRNSKISKKRT